MASIHTKRFDKEADSIEIYNPNYDLKIGGGWHDNYKFRIYFSSGNLEMKEWMN